MTLKTISKRVIIIVIVLTMIIIFFKGIDIYKRFTYPIKYENYVEEFAEKYNVDEYLIYSLIKTESGFNPEAVSNVGAKGLTQIMPDTFDWIKYRLGDKRELIHDDIFKPKISIQYGTYMMKLLLDEYGDKKTALAAYHAGRSQVNEWLLLEENSSNGITLDKIPSKNTAHYVSKVMKAYDGYNNLYNKKE